MRNPGAPLETLSAIPAALPSGSLPALAIMRIPADPRRSRSHPQIRHNNSDAVSNRNLFG
jgi:hypothetical protein